VPDAVGAKSGRQPKGRVLRSLRNVPPASPTSPVVVRRVLYILVREKGLQGTRVDAIVPKPVSGGLPQHGQANSEFKSDPCLSLRSCSDLVVRQRAHARNPVTA